MIICRHGNSYKTALKSLPWKAFLMDLEAYSNVKKFLDRRSWPSEVLNQDIADEPRLSSCRVWRKISFILEKNCHETFDVKNKLIQLLSRI